MTQAGVGVKTTIPDPAPVRVLWLIKGLGPGGAEHLLVSTARTADRTRFTFSVVYVLDWKSHLVDTLHAVDVEATSLGVRDARDVRWIWRLRRHVKRSPVDVIHVHSPLVAGALRLSLLTVRRRPVVLSTEHNSWASHGRPTRWLNRLTYRLDTAHIVVSDQVLASLPPKLQRRAEVIVHGVDVGAISEARNEREVVRAELGLAPDQIAICTVANLRWQKGYPDLFAAAKQVIDEGHDVVFLAVGQGPLEAELKQRHAELGLGDRFRMLGYRSDAIRVLVASDIFALASLHEGYPIAVMEAMVAGLPIVATDAGGVPEAVHNGVEGFVVPSQQPDQLAAALLSVITDPDLRRRMGEASLIRGQSYDIRPAIERTQGIYEELAARRRDR